MTTRTNFYKNPSYSYNKDFNLSSVLQNLRAYNAATGSAPPVEEPPSDDEKKVSRKRRPDPRRKPDRKEGNEEDDDGTLSHQSYIEKRRKEVKSSQVYQELTADVLGNPNSSFEPLVQYESDESTSSEGCEEKQDAPSSDHMNEVDRVKQRSEQRFPVPGEPVCVVCGKYGEYICNEGAVSNQDSLVCLPAPTGAVQMPECKEDAWDFERHRWTKKRSSLCAYECWKCQRPGHLAEDCLVVVEGRRSNSISRNLLALYRRCHHIGKSLSSANCQRCRGSSSLAMCLDCSTILCDSAGHLNEHIVAHPSHQQYYSYKLNRLVKCCKSTCNVTDIKDLLACHYCFDKAFDKFYDMYTATWKAAGLSIIWGSICCDEHFTWHRMNCSGANVEDSAYIIRKHALEDKCAPLSDFIF